MRFQSVFMIILVSAIYVVGLVMIFNTTSAEVLDLSLDQSPYHALLRQLLYGVVGVGLGLFVYRVGYRSVLFYAPQILLVLTFFLLLCLIPGIGREVNG